MRSVRFFSAMVGLALVTSACGRTGARSDDPPPPEVPPGVDAGDDLLPVPEPVVPPPPVPTSCEPGPETCDGSDEDCDGRVDEVPPEPCDGGGFRVCAAGRMSACPRRCEVCVPGSDRVCFINYCTFWGIQTCAADGRSFGPCREMRAPSECIRIARNEMDSPELEQCCVDNGHCCLDRHDLDGDDDRTESLGACGDVLCD